MSEDFITGGMANDRYIKADFLVNRFREQVLDAIEETSEQLIDEEPDLFEQDSDLDKGHWGTASRTLSTIRIEFNLRQDHEDFGSLKLNIGVEWVDPEVQDEPSTEGDTLCYVLYKIQRGSEASFDAVKQRTADRKNWPSIRFGDDQWPYRQKEAPGIVYIPIEDGPELMGGLGILRQHFSDVYAAELR